MCIFMTIYCDYIEKKIKIIWTQALFRVTSILTNYIIFKVVMVARLEE